MISSTSGADSESSRCEDEKLTDLNNSLEDGLKKFNKLHSEKVHLRCFAHTLQLVIKNSLKNCINVRRTMSKCFKIASKYHNKSLFKQLIDDKKYRAIPRQVSTRWNSELKVLSAINNVKAQDLTDALSQCSLTSLNISYYERGILSSLINFLEPFEFITDTLQGNFTYFATIYFLISKELIFLGESYCTISYAVPSLFRLLSHLNIFGSEKGTLQSLSISMTKDLKERYKDLFTYIQKLADKDFDVKTDMKLIDYDESCFIATFLDPIFKFYWL